MNTYEDDGELAMFMEEMRQEEPRLNALLKRKLPPRTAHIDHQSLLGLLRARNKMAVILREFVARHPEDTDLAKQAKRFL